MYGGLRAQGRRLRVRQQQKKNKEKNKKNGAVLMPLALGADTGYFPDLSLEDALERLASLGVRDVQVSAAHLGDDDALDRVRELCARLDVTVHQVHCDEELGPDARHVDAHLRWLEGVARLGARGLITHANNDADYNTDAERRRCFDLNRPCIEAIAPRAAELGLFVAVENRLERPWSTCKRFGARMRDLLELTDVPGCDRLGVCLDTSHTRVSRLSFADEVAQCGARLFATQVSDCDGETQHRMPFTLDIDWREVVNALKDVDYAGVLMLDVGANRGKSLAELDAALQDVARRFKTML